MASYSNRPGTYTPDSPGREYSHCTYVYTSIPDGHRNKFNSQVKIHLCSCSPSNGKNSVITIQNCAYTSLSGYVRKKQSLNFTIPKMRVIKVFVYVSYTSFDIFFQRSQVKLSDDCTVYIIIIIIVIIIIIIIIYINFI